MEENKEIVTEENIEEFIDEEGNPIDINNNDEFNNGKEESEDE